MHFLDENVRISFKISLKFVPKVPINSISALIQIMAWCRPGAKPSSKPMIVGLLTHICVIQPQWLNRIWHPTSNCIFIRVPYKWVKSLQIIWTSCNRTFHVRMPDLQKKQHSSNGRRMACPFDFIHICADLERNGLFDDITLTSVTDGWFRVFLSSQDDLVGLPFRISVHRWQGNMSVSPVGRIVNKLKSGQNDKWQNSTRCVLYIYFHGRTFMCGH